MKAYDVVAKKTKTKNVVTPKEIKKTPSRPVKKSVETIQKKTTEPIPWKYRMIRIGLFAGISSFLVLVYSIGIFFAHARIVITQRRIPFVLQTTSIDIPNETHGEKDVLTFQTLTVPATVSSKIFITSEADISAYIPTLQEKLTNKLHQQTTALVAEANNANKDAPEKKLLTFSTLRRSMSDPAGVQITKINASGSEVELRLSGTMIAYLLPEALFEKKIASYVVSGTYTSDIQIPELSNFSVSFADVQEYSLDTTTPPEQILLTVQGQGTAIVKVSPQQISRMVIGTHRNDFTSLLQPIEGIAEAEFTLYPFWAPFFPKQFTAVTVVIK